MPKATKRNVSVATSSSVATPAKPVSVKAAKRAVTVPGAKPVSAKPEKAAKPVTPAIAQAVTEAAAPSPRGLTRDAAGIVRAATNYAVYSDRDTAYLAFFGTVCRAHSGTATLRQIHDNGVTRSGMPDRKRFNPNYTGSGKATDVGAINRLIKAGYFTRSGDGNTITATPLAISSKAYSGK